MVVIGIISMVAFAVWFAIWSDVLSREEADRDLEVDYRAERFYELADAAERLRVEFGREPSVREIYAAIEPAEEREGETVIESDESENGPVVDLRARVQRITESRAESWIA